MSKGIPHSKLSLAVLNEEGGAPVLAGIGSLCRWAPELHLSNTCCTPRVPRSTPLPHSCTRQASGKEFLLKAGHEALFVKKVGKCQTRLWLC